MNIPNPNSAASLPGTKEKQFTSVHFKRIYFTFSTMCKCVGVDMCAYVQVPEEARGVRSPWAWVTGCCEPCDIRVGPLWEQHMFLTSELSVQLPHSHTSWQSPEWLDRWLSMFTKGWGFPCHSGFKLTSYDLFMFPHNPTSLTLEENKGIRLCNYTAQCSRTNWKS